MIHYTMARTDAELRGILSLQRKNLAGSLSPEDIIGQGFLTVEHDLSTLQKMNRIEPAVIAKEGDQVIAYLLAMTCRMKDDVPVLKPMFEIFDETMYTDKAISAYNYIVVGQVCVDKEYRGAGVLKECYALYTKHYRDKYDFAITEIDIKNTRSLLAHERNGFTTVREYVSKEGTVWRIVVLDWKK